MTTIELTTPSGYKIVLNDSLTYGQYEDIQSVMTDNIQIDPATGKPQGIDFKSLKEANKKAVEFLLVSITKDDISFTGSIRDLPAKDGGTIMAEIKRITQEAAPDQKKGI